MYTKVFMISFTPSMHLDLPSLLTQKLDIILWLNHIILKTNITHLVTKVHKSNAYFSHSSQLLISLSLPSLPNPRPPSPSLPPKIFSNKILARPYPNIIRPFPNIFPSWKSPNTLLQDHTTLSSSLPLHLGSLSLPRKHQKAFKVHHHLLHFYDPSLDQARKKEF